MPAYPSAQAKYDISDPASYPGSGSTIFDVSANSFDISLNNATYNSGSGVVPSIEFDGNSNSFGYFNGAIANIVTSSTTAFSFNVWIKAFYDTSAPGFECAWSYGTDAGGIPSLWLDRNANDPTYDGGSSNPLISSGFAAPDEWTLYSVVNNGTIATLYINGASYGSASTIGRGVGSPPKFLIGAFDTADFSTASYTCDLEFNRLEIHNTALTGAQVLEYYNATKTRYLLPDPFLSYDFSDPACYSGSGTTVFDLTVNNNDGTIAGPTFVSDGNKSYFNFNGGTDLITSATVPSSTLSNFTLNVWCFPENSSSENVVLSLGTDFSGGIPFIDYSLFTPGRFLISSGSGVATVEASIATPINEWYMVTFTKIGTLVEIYIDGVSAGTASGTIGLPDPAPLRLGGYSPGVAPNFDGRIAIFEIFASGLSGSQVDLLYNEDASRFLPPPVSNGVGGRSFAQGFNG
jgi:hypothetical protein